MPNHLKEKIVAFKKTKTAINADNDIAGIISFL